MKATDRKESNASKNAENYGDEASAKQDRQSNLFLQLHSGFENHLNHGQLTASNVYGAVYTGKGMAIR